MPNIPRPFCCPKCSRRAFTLVKLIRHIVLIHAREANFTMTCGLNDCQRTFSKYESFRRHVYRKHKHTVLSLAFAADEVRIWWKKRRDLMVLPVLLQHQIGMSCCCNLEKTFFSFILKCREKNHFPQSVQHELLEDVNFLFTFFKENYDD